MNTAKGSINSVTGAINNITGGINKPRFTNSQNIFYLLLLMFFISAFMPTTTMASRYTFTLFTNSSQSNMYVYQSDDGIHYTCISGPAYTPPEGLVRDPSVIKHSDGNYYVVYTTDWESTNFGIARSEDLRTWTFVTNIEVNVPDIKNTWAPEWFVDTDGSVNVIASLRTHSSSNFVPHSFTALNNALTSWSSGLPLSGLAPNYIDTFIVKIGDTYHAITKNETTKYLEHGTAENLAGPYTLIGTDDWAGWGNWIEGPTLTKLDNGDWRIYYDDYASPTGYYYSDSSDDLSTWTAPQVLPGGLSGFVRHGTVLKEDEDLLLSDGPVWSWDSYNFPGRLLRHTGVGNPVRVDLNVDPEDDALFIMTPGLADPNGVSFESVNNPGHYLRHWDYALRLHANSGTQSFKEDATFYYRKGLADPSYGSFQSYNFPDRYIRHYGYVLRIDPITSDTAKEDATFRFVGNDTAPPPYEGGKYDATVTIDGTDGGRIFDGIGLVNSSGSSKLLLDYPPEQQQDILDLLFKPNYGAGLTRMRNEIGGDINSSTGTEPSHQRTADETPTARGVNFWIARQAKDRNGNMQFIGNRWGMPAWAKASNANKVDYYLSYLQLMNDNGTPLDYLSPEENEGAFDRDYVVNQLKPTLNATGYSNLKLLGRDAYQSWGIADDLQSDPELKSVLAGINNHYVTTSTANAINSGLPLYNDESDTPMGELWPRMMYVAINNAKQYVDGKMTRILYQPALDSVYDTLKFNHKGLITANTPWSGHYTIHPSLWMTAHYTQFAKPGWQFLDGASGTVDGSTYYVTLRDPITDDYSTVIVNNGTSEVAFAFEITGGLSTGPVHVWRTTQSKQFIQLDDIPPNGNQFSITIPPQSIVSLTTTTGQQKGTPTFAIPEDADFSLPYLDDFSSLAEGAQPKYSYDQAGAFEAADCDGNPCLQQTVTSAPIDWWGGTSPTGREPHTVLGDPRWVNYQVSIDARIGDSGAVLLGGRGHLHQRDSKLPGSGYQLQVWASGHWYFRKTDFGSLTDIASGTAPEFDPEHWNNLKLRMNGTMISAYVNGVKVASIIDDTFSSGQVVLASSGYNPVAFDNLLIEPISESTDVTALKINDSNTDLITYSGEWEIRDGSWQDYHRSGRRASEAGAAMELTFTGSEVTILGRQATNGGQADVYIDDVFQTRIDTYGSDRYRAAIYKGTGLDSGLHSVKLVVTGTQNTSSSGAYVYIDSIEVLDGTDVMPTPEPTPEPTELIVNDSVTGTGDNQFEYVGSWSYGNQTGAYSGDNHWEGDTDGYYQVRFNGVQTSVYGAIATNHGIAAISIDGGDETLVDFYGATRKDQALVYTSPILDYGPHILKVRVTGTKNSASSGVVITADRVDITISTPTTTPSPEPSGPVIHNASSAQPGNEPQNLLDGDTSGNSVWSANGFPQSVVIDYGETQRFVGTELWTYQSRAYQYTVEVSDNPNDDFTTIVDRSSNTNTAQPITDHFAVATGRYLRINITGASGYSGSWVTLNDFAITTTEDLPKIDLGLSLTGPESLQACSQMPFAFSVTNHSEQDAESFYVGLTLPEGVRYFSGNSRVDNAESFNSKNTVVWHINTLPAGDTLTVPFDLEMSSSIPAGLTANDQLPLEASLITTSIPDAFIEIFKEYQNGFQSGFTVALTDPTPENNASALNLNPLAGVFANQGLLISDGVNINATTSFARHFTLGAHSALTSGGSALVNGPALLRSHSLIEGKLTLTGRYALQEGAEIKNGVQQISNISVPSLPFFSVNVGTEDVTINNDQRGTWAPGQYRNAVVRARGTLTLNSGEYHFNHLNIEADAKIIFNGNSGPIKIFTEEKLHLNGSDSMLIPENTKILLYTNSQQDINLSTNNSEMNVSILAPKGKVIVHSNALFHGSIGAEFVQIDPGATINVLCE